MLYMPTHLFSISRICRIFWTISNFELHPKTYSELFKTTIKKRCVRWLGHILRISHNRSPRVALRWTPQGKRKQGMPVEKQSRKRLKQWVYGARQKWPLSTKLVRDIEWRYHAPCMRLNMKSKILFLRSRR